MVTYISGHSMKKYMLDYGQFSGLFLGLYGIARKSLVFNIFFHKLVGTYLIVCFYTRINAEYVICYVDVNLCSGMSELARRRKRSKPKNEDLFLPYRKYK